MALSYWRGFAGDGVDADIGGASMYARVLGAACSATNRTG